jgi:putative transposase
MSRSKKPKEDPILDDLVALYPPQWLRAAARETGLVLRERVVDPVAMFWVLILGFGTHFQRELEMLRRSYEEETGTRLAYASWYERFTPELVAFFKACFARGLEYVAQAPGRALKERLARFQDLLVVDSTIVRLHKALAKKWPAVRARGVAAGLKVHLVISAVAAGPQRVLLSGERTHDSHMLRLGAWVKDRVLLLDLGYYKFQAFARIQEYGGFFVSRLKSNANPTITKLVRTVRGNSVDVVGHQVADVLPRLRRQVLDVLVEVSFRRRSYGGSQSGDTAVFRLVAVWDAESRGYHVYLTNIMDDVLSAEDVAALYGARWDIELVFKELKSRYGLDKIPSKNPQVIEALLWIALITLVISRRVYLTMRAGQPEANWVRYTSQRWAKVFSERAHLLEGRILAYNGIEPTTELIASVYHSQALDPHVNRERLMDRWVS